MADNITEADERIIQLLAALNSTLGRYTASQESDTSDNLANQLSSTALVVSLIALIIALLQAVLEYMSSNSAQGDKCDTGAIGEWARVSRRRWSWRHWRRQYFYPELGLSPTNLGFFVHDLDHSEVGKVFKGLDNLFTPRLENYEEMELKSHERTECYSWRYHRGSEHEGFQLHKYIRNGRYHLFRRSGAAWVIVRPRHLPMKYRLKWYYHYISHGRANNATPRATWAQLFTLLNVDPLNVKPGRSTIDANSIPSSLDVPAQKVKLTDLGCFAFCLGFRHVKIDTKARTILATGEIGTITTESMPGFGAVVRLQVSSPQPQQLVVEYSVYEMCLHREQLHGSFIFVGCFGWETVQYSSLRRKFINLEKDVDDRCPTMADEVNRWLEITTKGCKHEHSEAPKTDLCLECLAVWQLRAGGRSWPTILLAASAASIPRITTGFPSPFFLGPFLQVFQRLARCLSSSSGAIWSLYTFESLQEGTVVLELLRRDFCRVIGHEYLTWGSDILETGQLSWMLNTCGHREIELIEKVLLSRICTGNRRPRDDDATLTHFWEPFVSLQRNETSDTEAPDTSDLVDAESLTDGRLMPYIVELFNNFDPVNWAAVMRGQSSPKYDQHQTKATRTGTGEWMGHVQPRNVLWTQTFLLDLAITKSCHQHTTSIEAVSRALVESWEEPWEPASEMTAPLQNLHQFLYRKAFKDQTSEEVPEEARGLADMIKARMLCYIAYMMVIPDSTSLYKASLEDPVVLPMI